MEKSFDENAYSQAYAIVNFLVEEGEIIISQELWETLENKRNVNYTFDLNDIGNIELNPDTEKILTIVFLEFIASEEEKTEIDKAIRILKKAVINEEETIGNELLPIDFSSLKWSKRIKLKMKKLFSINSRNTRWEETSKNGYQK